MAGIVKKMSVDWSTCQCLTCNFSFRREVTEGIVYVAHGCLQQECEM